VEEVVKELELRINTNRLSASSIADIVYAFSDSQVKLMKSRQHEKERSGGGGSGGKRESYIRDSKKRGTDSLQMYSSQFHPVLLNLISNFVRIMGNTQRDKGSFNGVLFNSVTNGIYRMQLKWADIGDTQRPFLEAFGRACPAIRKQDLDFIMGTLGGSGLTWYAIPYEVRGRIVKALDRVLREMLLQRQGLSDSDGNNGGRNNYSSSGSNSSDGDSSGNNKHESIHNTLYGMAQLRLSLTPERLSPELCALVMQCVEVESVSMGYWKLARTVWHLARLSDRGMMVLPPSTLHALCTRLDQLLTPNGSSSSSSSSGGDNGSTASSAAERQNDANILWGLGVMGVTWSQLDSRARDNLLRIGSRNVVLSKNSSSGGSGGSSRHGRKESRAEIAAHFGRLGVDAGTAGPSGEWLLSAEEGGLLYRIAKNNNAQQQLSSPSSYPLLLSGIAKIVVNSPTLASSQRQAVESFVDDCLHDLESYLRDHGDQKHLLSKRELCNLLWSLGTLGRTWDNGSGDDATVVELSPELRGLLLKQIALLFRRDPLSATSGNSGSSGMMGAVRGTASAGGANITPVDEGDELIDDAHGYNSSSSGGSSIAGGSHSILPHLSTNTLSFSSLQTLGSFRELLYPSANHFRQTDIYNWLGSLAVSRTPLAALPDSFANALLVALAADLSLQGPSTVAHIVELLSACNLSLAVYGGEKEGEQHPSHGEQHEHELPAWLVPELVRKICTSCSGMTSGHLLQLVKGLSNGLCPDLNSLSKLDSHATGELYGVIGDDASDHNSSNNATSSSSTEPALGVLLSRRLSQAIAASLAVLPAPASTDLQQDIAVKAPWNVKQMLTLVETLHNLRWAEGSSWSGQSVLAMHSALLARLLACPDSELQSELRAASAPQREALRRYVGATTEEEEHSTRYNVTLRAFPSLAADAVGFAEKWDQQLII
jgi:hypothetical protein